jgi:hypothetical protein
VVALALALALAVLVAPAGAATGGSGETNRAGEESLSIWAYFDGDTTVSGGTVRVYADGRRLRERGDGPVTTIPGGMAMLRFDSLPSALRVVVTGGRAGGKRVEGSLSTKVRHVTDGDLVHVNPVTTVSDLLAHREDGPGLRHARDLTERTLGIRPILDDFDLWATDRWFEGDRFRRWALERGSVGAGARRLVRIIERPGFDRRQFDPPDGDGPEARAAASGGASAGNVLNGLLAAGTCGGAIAKDVIGGIADNVASAAGLTGPEGFALGLAVTAFKQIFNQTIPDCGDQSPGEDPVSAQLRGISAQITQVKNQIDAKFLNLRIKTVGEKIDAIQDTQAKFMEMLAYAKAREKALDPSKPGDPPGKDRCTSETCTKAQANLVDATKKFLTGASGLANAGEQKPTAITYLNTQLTDQATPTRVSGLISDVRESIGNERFFTDQSSQRIRSFFQYYAWWQVELATVLSEYYLLGGDCAFDWQKLHPGQVLTSNNCKPLQDPAAKDAKTIKENIEKQGATLPPKDLDPRVFIDRTSKLMWLREPTVRGASEILSDGTHLDCGILSWKDCSAYLVNTEREFQGLGVRGKWDIPTADLYRDLFAGDAAGLKPSDPLNPKATLNPGVPLDRLKLLGVSPKAGFFQGNPAGYLWLRGGFNAQRYKIGTAPPHIFYDYEADLFELKPGGPTDPNQKTFRVGQKCSSPASIFPAERCAHYENFAAYIIWHHPMDADEGGNYWCQPGQKSWDPAKC